MRTPRSAPSAVLLAMFAALGLSSSLALAQSGLAPERSGWQRAPAPMTTRWGAAVDPTQPLPEYPRPQLVRRDWLCLNGLWDYGIEAAGDRPPRVYAGKILVPFPLESALSGVLRRLKDDEVLWYHRTFRLPASWAGRRVHLRFGAVDWEARVWVNGVEVGRHRGGYDAFAFDITDRLSAAPDQDICVAVTDPTEGDQPRGKQSRQPEGIFYTPTSGIWQTVWLEPVPADGVERLRLTPDLDRKALRLQVLAGTLREGLRCQAVAFAQGREVGRVSGDLNTELTLPLSTVRPWSPDDPFLYDLTVTVRDADRDVDSVASYFGLRHIGLVKDDQGRPRIALNHRPLFQLGVLDQGFWPDGVYTAPADDALSHDLRFVRAAGFNLIRKHVKVEPERWYYWCDRLGLLVWQDMPSANSLTLAGRTQFEAEVARMVAGRGNHPCVVMWVLFNEGWGQYDTERLVRWLKALDPSRLVNNASGWTDKQVGDVCDTHSYPGPEPPLPEAERATVQGEFGGLGWVEATNVWSPRAWSYRMFKDAAELTATYTALLERVRAAQLQTGLSGAVYTQLSDVESECNGLLSYDRGAVKIPTETLARLHRELTRPPHAAPGAATNAIVAPPP